MSGGREPVFAARYERDYLERTIATVRNHRGADNCWPQWANIFADEIERLWQIEQAADLIRASDQAGGDEWWEAHAKLYRALGDPAQWDANSHSRGAGG